MGMWTAIFLIVTVALVASVIRHGLDSRSGKRQQQALDAMRDEWSRSEAELRQRIETLEAIVTDGKADLRRQFEDLDKAS